MKMRLQPTVPEITSAATTRKTFTRRCEARSDSISPNVRYTIADIIEWLLGKLGESTYE